MGQKSLSRVYGLIESAGGGRYPLSSICLSRMESGLHADFGRKACAAATCISDVTGRNSVVRESLGTRVKWRNLFA